MADPNTETTQAIAEQIEAAMTAVAIAADLAGEDARTGHRVALLAELRVLEDLRLRNEEYDPATEAYMYPNVIRSGSIARAVRLAVAQDESCAVYKQIGPGAGHNPSRTPFFIIYPYVHGSEVRREQAASPVHLAHLPDADKYVWDDREEYEAAVAGRGAVRA